MYGHRRAEVGGDRIRTAPAARNGAIWLCLWLLALASAFASVAANAQAQNVERPVAVDGEINLERWNFSFDRAWLDGEWQVYWNRLLDPLDFRPGREPDADGVVGLPSAWNDLDIEGAPVTGQGYATYRVFVRLPINNQRKSLVIEEMHTTYRLWLNDELVATSGLVGKNAAQEVPRSVQSFVSIPTIQTEFWLTLQVSNFTQYQGGPLGRIWIGLEEEIEGQRLFNRSLTMFLFGTALIIALYNFVTWGLRREEDSYLYFGLFSLLMSVYLLASGRVLQSAFPDIPDPWLWTIEHVALFMSAPTYMWFLASLFRREMSETVLRLALLLGIGASILAIMTPATIFTQILEPYLFVTGVWGLYMLGVMVLALLRRRSGSVLSMAGLMAMTLAASHDIALFLDVHLGSPLLGYGFLVFISSQSAILARRFSRAFSQNENLSAQLALLNRELELQVEERTEDLANKSGLLEATLDSMNDGICAIDKDGHILVFNEKYAEVMGYPRELVRVGAAIRDLIFHQAERGDFGDDPRVATATAEAVLRNSPVKRYAVFERTLHDGRVIEIRANAMPDGGEVTMVVDVTEARQRAVELREKSELLVATLASMTDGISVVDPDGRLVTWNDRYIEMFQIPRQYTTPSGDYGELARFFAERGDFGDGDHDKQVDRQILKSTLSVAHTEERTTPDGRLVEIRTNPMRTGGTVTTYQDVTDLRNRELELELARQSAEDANAAKSNFLATMSHEIRTPMNGILGMLELLADTRLSDAQHDLVGTVRESALSLLKIINDILDFSKIEAGKLELEIIELCPQVLVEGVADLLAGNARTKDIQLTTRVDPAIAALTWGDPVRLRQVLFNLTGNAIKFTEHGHIGIRAFLDAADPDHIRFEISDTGIGMNEAQIARLFKPFSQADDSTTRKFGGTGLGLSICKRLVEMMGGRIGVTSTPGEGSVFWFTVRLETVGEADLIDTAENEAARVPIYQDLTGLSVLVLESRSSAADIQVDYLRAAGAEALRAADRDEAAAQLAAAENRGRPVDVAVVDYQVGGDQGLAIADSLHRAHAATNGGVAVGLPSRDGNLAAEVARFGLEAHIVRPLRRATLLQAVAKAAGCAVEAAGEDDAAPIVPANAHQNRTALGIEDARAAGTLILVAEDHPTNQRLILMQLAKLGWTCELAENGRIALEMWRDRSFGLLLTDFHMPEMDGLALTKTVRAEEREKGIVPRIPIIALTANALEGEAERCLEAGMDGFLSKPVNLRQLDATLTQWLGRSGPAVDDPTDAGAPSAPTAPTAPKAGSEAEPAGADTAPGAPRPFSTSPMVDKDHLADFFGDDAESAADMIESFLDTNGALATELETAIDGRDWTAAKEKAHAIKGSSYSIGLTALGDLGKELEEAAKLGNWPRAAAARPYLQPILVGARAAVDILKSATYDGLEAIAQPLVDVPPAPDGTEASAPEAEPPTADAPNDFADSPAIDHAHLDDFFGGDGEAAVEMLEAFLSTNTDLIGTLGAALAAANLEEATHAAHSIKGSSWSIGLRQLGDVAQAIEQAGKAEDTATMAATLPALEAARAAAAAAVAALKTKHGLA